MANGFSYAIKGASWGRSFMSYKNPFTISGFYAAVGAIENPQYAQVECAAQ
jgi:hypothetical protein